MQSKCRSSREGFLDVSTVPSPCPVTNMGTSPANVQDETVPQPLSWLHRGCTANLSVATPWRIKDRLLWFQDLPLSCQPPPPTPPRGRGAHYEIDLSHQAPIVFLHLTRHSHHFTLHSRHISTRHSRGFVRTHLTPSWLQETNQISGLS